MPDTLDDEEKRNAQSKMDALIAEFKETHPQLKLRSIVEEYDPDAEISDPHGLNIGRVRHDYMDLIAWDASQRGFGVDHPVIVLDADIKQMTKDAFQKLADRLTAPDSPVIMAHAKVDFLFEKDTGIDEQGRMSDERKLATLQEIRRRQFGRIANRDLADGQGKPLHEVYSQFYDEEWGSALALGPHLMAGGYSDRSIMNENRDLRWRMNDFSGTIMDALRYAKPGIPGRNYRYTKRFIYLTDITVRSSGRRAEDYMRRWLHGDEDISDESFERKTALYVEGRSPYHDDFGHTNALRDQEARQERPPADRARLAHITQAILNPSVTRDTSPFPDSEFKQSALPDPSALIQRLDLPTLVDEKPKEKN